MTKVYPSAQIQAALAEIDLTEAMERAFVAYSRGLAVVPPVGELLFDEPPGEAHIKYGYIRGDDIFVVKVATGFYDNPKQGLAANSGLLLLFDARTGQSSGVLLDEGHLTDARTAAAGAVAAKYLAPSKVERIGICGTGVQARLQLRHLARVIRCRNVVLWGRSSENAGRLADTWASEGYAVEIASEPNKVAERCQLIVTTTASHAPLITEGVRPGTHITAIGSDTPEKTELSPGLLAAADLVVVDSLPQSEHRGELYQARKAGVRIARVAELGAIIEGTVKGRNSDRCITISDLTGVAVQDIEAAKAMLARLSD